MSKGPIFDFVNLALHKGQWLFLFCHSVIHFLWKVCEHGRLVSHMLSRQIEQVPP